MGDIILHFEANSGPTLNFVDLSPIMMTLARLETKLDLLMQKEDLSLANEGMIMSAMDDLETKLTAAETAADVADALLSTIHQELVDILATGATPARIQALADRVDADTAKYVAAAAANPDPNAPPAGP